MIRSSSFLFSIRSSGWSIFWPRLTRGKENYRSASQLARGELQGRVVGDQFCQRNLRFSSGLKSGKDQRADLLHVRRGKGAGQGRGHNPTAGIERETSGRQADQTE